MTDTNRADLRCCVCKGELPDDERIDMTTANASVIDDSPDYAYCKHCGRVLVWDDWSYTHLDGWANCRQKNNQSELDPATHAEVLKGVLIEPQPLSVAEAWNIPIIVFVIGEDGTKYPWRKGDPMPVLTIRGDSQ